MGPGGNILIHHANAYPETLIYFQASTPGGASAFKKLRIETCGTETVIKADNNLIIERRLFRYNGTANVVTVPLNNTSFF